MLESNAAKVGRVRPAAQAAAHTIGAATAAEVVVRVGPPAPIVERRVVSPGPGYVWTPGYHRWDGNRYEWTAGAWVRLPGLDCWNVSMVVLARDVEPNSLSADWFD